jgi:hypothetical protein
LMICITYHNYYRETILKRQSRERQSDERVYFLCTVAGKRTLTKYFLVDVFKF